MTRRWWTAGVLCSLAAACSDNQSVVGGDAGSDTGSTVVDLPTVDVPSIDVVDVQVAPDLPSIDAVDVPPAVDVPFRCSDNASCAGNAGGAVCDTASGRCVQCVASADTCPAGQYCVASTNACAAGCRNDEGCATGGDGGASMRHCDTATHACFDCLTDDHCPSGTLCVGNLCVAGCNATRACPSGQSCCGGACVDPQTNVAHCGACDARCTITNGTSLCMNGTCAVGACTAPNANCDGNAANGCETNTQTDVAHCGACMAACAARANATARCAAGSCAYECATGFADCDMDPSNGCEVDTRTSTAHCGRCGNWCSLANSTATCAAGVCAVDVCAAGFGNCDGNAANGCETDTRTSTSHCGACAAACPARANAVPACSASACSSVCVAGYGECNGSAGDGCETNLATSATHCGACGRTCMTANVATASCSASACTIGSCAAGFADCDGMASTGCELDVRADVNHCGACGRTCTAGQSCVSGVCATQASCAAIHAARPSLPSGVYPIDPDGAGAVAGFEVYCDMETAGGGWTLAFIKNSAHRDNYGDFGAAYRTVSALANNPLTASSSATGVAGWVDLNAFPYSAMRLAGYQNGARTYLSNEIQRSSLRIAFGQPGYLLYNDPNGYYWCGGPASYTDGGSGQVNRPAGAPADCKGHGSLGDGWDFSTSTGVNQGLTLCGANASNWMYGVYGSGVFIFYPTPGAAYAIWVR